MPLTPEGKELLLEAKANILANPEFYDQNDLAYEEENKCGTVCCVAGWIDFIHYGPKAHRERAKDSFCMWNSSRDLLGLTEDESFYLFSEVVTHPDFEFSEEYEMAGSERERAKAAGRMIDRFIANHS